MPGSPQAVSHWSFGLISQVMYKRSVHKYKRVDMGWAYSMKYFR